MRVLATTLVLLCWCWLAAAEDKVVTVQKGDTLEKIAQKHFDDAKLWPQLAAYNDLDNPDFIRAGQRIVVPEKAQLLLGNEARNALQARVTALEKLVQQYLGVSGGSLLADNFEEGQLAEKPSGWHFPSSGKWGLAAKGSWVLAQSDRRAGNSAAITGKKDWQNYTVQVELQVSHSGDAGLFAYWNSHLANYRLRTEKHQGRIELVKRAATGPDRYDTIVLNHMPFQLTDGRWYVFKLEVTSHDSYAYLKGKVWTKGVNEPGTWQLEASDHAAGRYPSGQAGVWTTSIGTSYRGAQFDNFQVIKNRQ